ncbi:MAG TPA: DNA-formamidopyrimidine glycosylase family protein [Verrucomicrobiae bacterium]|jgi:formamidopyrimidine-DNA glycosylase|nr:DNA-formamidopyrimidine glycosylase family protein [Verrucomicrobiae bacterium]
MPELAEVEFFRKQWPCSRSRVILAVEATGRRIFRGVEVAALQRALTGAALLESKTHGKQMLFRFSGNAWLGVHLGMSGKLHARPNQPADKHDHLVLRRKDQDLVYTDPRMFGRILFEISPRAPVWWTRLPAPVLSREFTLARVSDFLARHGRAPLKAVLLLQAGFPGIGNWMADEILWQARLHPRRRAGSLKAAEQRRLHTVTRSICRVALRTIGKNWSDPPSRWLIHRRWRPGGHCPREGAALRHDTVGGRTTCLCPVCQKPGKKA